ncbi:type II toxin-antitoxin system HipA family toxin [Vibrio sp. VB16]|uniref:type II toxin-antitoxin system HipA family toxin n=1 Tax=Vibrio sp. VB16 TaxID=2785746 RepID=UPI00189DAC6A|nr:type II toxin-antitoxin system HipA family toxin [Vibrio sp. VB16]UGA57344.1 type II toxin-antitoxin system HipA family toxin [Vibrio sp. VB16]
MANVDVYTHKSRVGRLEKKNENHHYSYDLNAKHALSLTMPIRLETYSYEGLHPFFQMNMPEGGLRLAIEKATEKHYGSNDLTVLALLGNNQIGSIRYALEDQELVDESEFDLSLEHLIKSEDVDLFSELLSRFALRSGVAGVQPKVLLDAKQINNNEIEPKNTYPLDSYIVKSWGKEYPELACNEFVCLSIAKEAGLTVSPFYLSENARLLITKRFDINKENQPIGFEDFCVLQGRSTKQKYDASLESCANTIRQFVSPEFRKTALYDFFKLTVINIMLKNGDAHLKNYGVLYENLSGYQLGELPKTSVVFSPVFDIVSTTPYIKNDTMALSLTGSKRWPKWKVLVKFAKQHCLLSNKEITQVIDEIERAKLHVLPIIETLSIKHQDFSHIADEMLGLLEGNIKEY